MNARVMSHPDDNAFKWQNDEKKALQSMGFQFNPRPWTCRAGVSLRGLSGTFRERSIIDICWLRAAKRTGKHYLDETIRAGLFCDPSQTLQRAGDVGLRTQCQKSTKYSYELDRVLLAGDQLGLMGFPTSGLDGLPSERQRLGFVGECVSPPCLATAICCMLLLLNADGLFEQPP
eukprot:9456451-Pyramimonas_sp.AAC.1